MTKIKPAFIFSKEAPGFARIIQDLLAGCFRIHWSDKAGSLYQFERIRQPTDVKRISEFEPEYFERLLHECEGRAEDYRKEIEKYHTENDPWNEGCAHKSLGNILMELFSEEMPYWNLVTDSWDLPQDKDDWAVMVTLY